MADIQDNSGHPAAPIICEYCGGRGWFYGQQSGTECCGGSQWECGASGCTGPIEVCEEIQVQCDCGGHHHTKDMGE